MFDVINQVVRQNKSNFHLLFLSKQKFQIRSGKCKLSVTSDVSTGQRRPPGPRYTPFSKLNLKWWHFWLGEHTLKRTETNHCTQKGCATNPLVWINELYIFSLCFIYHQEKWLKACYFNMRRISVARALIRPLLYLVLTLSSSLKPQLAESHYFLKILWVCKCFASGS